MVMLTVPPSQIDIEGAGFGMFESWKMVEPAKDLVAYAQEHERLGNGVWVSFTREDVERFTGRNFYFLGLLNHYIVEDKEKRGTYNFTHRFVECCF